jgi:hypothetical protein
MFGGCTYGNGAGGTHNNDIIRLNLNTGASVLLANCSNNVWGWKGGCQAGHAYDINRNCVWVADGGAPVCGGQGGLWRFQCPNGPFVRMNEAPGNKYVVYDRHNDLLYQVNQYDLEIYDCKANRWLTKSQYPFYIGGSVNTYSVPCCYDTLRKLFVMTLLNPAYGNERTDMYFYNGAAGEWHTKYPSQKPGFLQGALEYDPVNDAYVYIGGICTTEVWIYRYESNTWTKMDPGSRAYNDASPQTSPWPPTRHWGIFDTYSPKHNAFFTWSGGVWGDSHCTDYDNGTRQPFWVYRPPQDGPTAVQNVRLADDADAPHLRVWPNPFNGTVNISINGVLSGDVETLHPGGECLGQTGCNVSTHPQVAIYNIHGKMISEIRSAAAGESAVTWNATGLPTGVYVLRVRINGKTLIKRLFLQK